MSLSDGRLKINSLKTDQARLAVSRCAADLFWKHGFEATTGDTIAAAAGLSKRTVWRYFRSKEACVEPLFLVTGYRFVRWLAAWPRDTSLETYLRETIGSMLTSSEETRDAVAAARLVSRFEQEPALLSAYLMASAQAERELIHVFALRAGRSISDFEVKLCAAAASAALRVVDEAICRAAIIENTHFSPSEVAERLAAAIRSVSALPICDPVT